MAFNAVSGGGGSISALNTLQPKCSRQIAPRSFSGRSSVEKRTIEKSFSLVMWLGRFVCCSISAMGLKLAAHTKTRFTDSFSYTQPPIARGEVEPDYSCNPGSERAGMSTLTGVVVGQSTSTLNGAAQNARSSVLGSCTGRNLCSGFATSL